MIITVNYFAILVAAVASMVVGFLWYGPVFGKMWVGLMEYSPEKMEELKKKGMGKSYALTFLGSLIMAYVLAHFIVVWVAVGFWGAFQLAFWIWLGFIMPLLLGSVLWEGKSWKLYFLNIAYWFVMIFVMSLILTFWI